MKILIIADYLRGKKDNLGGGELYDLELKELLEERGHQVEILSGKKPLSSLKKNIEELFSIYSFKWKKKAKEKIDSFEPDIIFTHTLRRQITTSFFPHAQKKNIPIVMKIGNVGDFRYIGHLDSKIRVRSLVDVIRSFPKKVVYRKMIKKYINTFIAPSEFTANYLEKSLGLSRSKIQVIHNPLLFDTDKNSLEHNSEERVKQVLFVGSVRDFKGMNFLINSFEVMSEELSECKLKIVGSGNINKYRRIVGQKNLEDRIDFEGYVKHGNLKKYYRNSDLLISPSLIKENSPLAPIEAMSQGLPVVTTNIGGQRELVKEGYNGYLVNPNNVSQLSNKIIKIIEDNELREEMSQNSLEFAKKFSKEKHLEEMEELFKDVIG